MSTPLLTTKLNIPSRRPTLVPRPRLAAGLDEARRLKRFLTMVSATAGGGKTTLVSKWLHQQGRPAAWLSLDTNDNDPRRFLNYLIAALSSLDINIPPNMLSHLQTPVLSLAETLFVELVNDVAAGPKPFLLVLDDYHLIQNEWIMHGSSRAQPEAGVLDVWATWAEFVIKFTGDLGYLNIP
jgi:LuxR family maltose regulon positive regulatory protein